MSQDIVPTIKECLKACSVGPYRKIAGTLINRPLAQKMAFVDNSKVSDHHAIIPTEQFVQLDHMTVDERRIYDLVVRRFLAVLYPPCEYEQTEVTVRIGSERFTARANVVTQTGWKTAYEGQSGSWEEDESTEAAESSADSQKLLSLKEGDVLKGVVLAMTEGKTKPPAPLMRPAFCLPWKIRLLIWSQRIRLWQKTLGETGGLGTVATRADIIEKLFPVFT